MQEYQIEESHEEPRECGYRKPGAGGVGIYLMGGSANEHCERLPYPLTVCPCCGGGFSPARGFTWFSPEKLIQPEVHACNPEIPYHDHAFCVICTPALAGERAGILWVGEKFYATPADFMVEAATRGISRKIGAMPNDFEIGVTWIYLAHNKAILHVDEAGKETFEPGFFMVYRPTRVDLVVDVENPAELPERAKNLKDRLGDAARFVRVVKEGATDDQFAEAESDD